MRKVIKESPELNVRTKMREVGNIFIPKREVCTHEAIKRTLSLPMKSSSIGCDFIFTSPSEKRLMVLKPQDVLHKMHPEDSNVFTNGIIEKYANCPDDLENEYYANFETGYVNVNTKGVVEDDNIANYTTPVSNLDKGELEEGKMRKWTQSRVMKYHKVSKLEEPELHYMTLL